MLVLHKPDQCLRFLIIFSCEVVYSCLQSKHASFSFALHFSSVAIKKRHCLKVGLRRVNLHCQLLAFCYLPGLVEK